MTGSASKSHSLRCFKTLTAAACDSRLSRGDLGCLAVILNRYNVQEGAAWPGISRIAREANLASRNVVHSIKRLADYGYVLVDHGNVRKANRYTPTFRQSDDLSTGDVDVTAPTDADDISPSDADITTPSDADDRGLLMPASPQVLMPTSNEHIHRTYSKNISNTRTDSCQQVLDSYHQLLPRCQRISVLNDKRRKRIQVAIKLAKQICDKQDWEYDGDQFWSAYFSTCAKDPWLRGDVANPKNPSWKQNLDVLLAEDRIAGILDSEIEMMRDAPIR